MPKSGTQVVQLRHEDKTFSVAGPEGDHILRLIQSNGFYELDLLRAVQSLNLEGTYVDVGANIGNHCLFFASCCPATSLIAIEPTPRAFAYLVRNLSQVPEDFPIEFVNCAIGDEVGLVAMQERDPGNLGMNRVMPGETTALRTLDTVLSHLGSVALIKVDVEGAEPEVLKGALNTIRHCLPVLVVEASTDTAQAEVRSVLEPLGYAVEGPYGATPTWIWKHRPRIAVLATLYERREIAARVVDSIFPQVDLVYVVLNRVGSEPVDEWQKSFPQENVQFHVRDNVLGDAERYYPVKTDAAYYLSIDDDLLYPDGYVQRMVEGVERYRGPVCMHGKYYPTAPVSSYIAQPDMRRYQCREKQGQDAPVQVPGTGVTCWRGDLLDLQYERFSVKNRADLEVAKLAAKAGARITCLAHEPLEYLPPPGTTIWDVETSKDGPELVAALNEVLASVRKGPRISVSMIVKNEEAHLAAALESVKDADEIVIVDTGSEDSTIEIAKRYTDKVFSGEEFKWRDDFSFSRNQSLDRCTGDWVLIIDADETLEPGGIPKARELLAKARNAKAFGVRCIAGIDNSVHITPRLFRRIPEIRWHAPIHNYISVSNYKTSDLTITYGYSLAHKKDPDRALRILSKVLQDNPKAVRETYYLAREYYYRKDWATAEKWYRDYLTRAYYGPEIADAWLAIARCKVHLKRFTEAKDACLQAIGLNANFKEACLMMADLSGPGNKKRWLQIAETASNEGILFVRTP